MPQPCKEGIWKMFDAIASTYDKTNRWMTFGLDLRWRKKLASFLPEKPSLQLLDCATGTGDQILVLMQHSPSIQKAIGVDLSQNMLSLAQAKVAQSPFASRIELQVADILSLPFAENSFDCVTISFGIRNVTDVSLCLQEIFRVLKPSGRLLILETSAPRLGKTFHRFYLTNILPKIGAWISRKKSAYEYLNQTAQDFPSGEQFCHFLRLAGYSNIQTHPLSLGAVSIYCADKPPSSY